MYNSIWLGKELNLKQVEETPGFILFAPVIFALVALLGLLIYDLNFESFNGDLYVLVIVILFILFFLRRISKKIDTYKSRAILHEKELKSNNEILKQQLYLDDLTKLHNLKSFDKDLLKTEKPKVILLNIDGFKDINEFYGKENGNVVLREMAQMIKDFAKEQNMRSYRIGSDEFALLDEDQLDISKYEKIAVELVETFKTKEIFLDDFDTSVVVNMTIGFSLESEDAFSKALIALNFAKSHQKDFACYIRGMDTKEEYAYKLKYTKLIKHALEENRVIPYYQPILNRNEEIIKYEVLSRVKSEDGEVISPGQFMGTSKKARLYSVMAKKIIDESFKEIAKTDKSISFNLLSRDMMDSDISNYVIDKIREYKIAKQIIFEILEDESIEHLDRVSNFINKVKRMGVRIAIDDFGTGYSNFSYLLQLKPDYLKIDGSIVKNIDTDTNSKEIVHAIVSFAQALHVKTIAEFIHSKEVYDECYKLGVDEFQGFYLGEPNPVLI